MKERDEVCKWCGKTFRIKSFADFWDVLGNLVCSKICWESIYRKLVKGELDESPSESV